MTEKSTHHKGQEHAFFEHGFALVIGADEASLGTQCTQDARAIHNVLSDRNICAYANVDLISGLDATKEEIVAGFSRLEKKLKKRAAHEHALTTVVYFSGHGTYAPQFGLVAVGEPTHNNIISSDEFASLLGSLRTGKLLVILDCCYAGGMGFAALSECVTSLARNLNGIGEQKRAKGAAGASPDDLGKGMGGYLIASSTPYQPSYIPAPDAKVKLSYFTEGVVQGLQGKAAEPGHAYIRIMKLVQYASDFVAGHSDATAGQRPVHGVFGMADNFPVALAPRRRRRVAGPAVRKPSPVAINEKENMALYLRDVVGECTPDAALRFRALPDGMVLESFPRFVRTSNLKQHTLRLDADIPMSLGWIYRLSDRHHYALGYRFRDRVLTLLPAPGTQSDPNHQPHFFRLTQTSTDKLNINDHA